MDLKSTNKQCKGITENKTDFEQMIGFIEPLWVFIFILRKREALKLQ